VSGLLGAITTVIGAAADGAAAVVAASQAKRIRQLESDVLTYKAALAKVQETATALAHDLDIRADTIVTLRRQLAAAEERANALAARVNVAEMALNKQPTPDGNPFDTTTVPSDDVSWRAIEFENTTPPSDVVFVKPPGEEVPE